MENLTDTDRLIAEDRAMREEYRLSTLSRGEVHDAMIAADRDRARIAYRGVDFDRRDGGKAQTDRNRRTPEYREAAVRFEAAAARLREIDGDSTLRDRRGRRVSI